MTNDGDPLPPLMVEPFVHVPLPGGGRSMKMTNRGTRHKNISKALLESIILLNNLKEYMTASEQQLIDRYTDL